MGKTRDLFRKTGDINRIFHARMGTIKDRNGMDLTEVEDIKKRWQEYTEEVYKNGLNDLDDHNGVVTNLKPDILECEVKWALGSIITYKASRADGIPVELFKILKVTLLKCCTQHVSKFGILSSGPRIGKGQFSFQSQRRAVQFHSFSMLVRLCSKSFKLLFSSM